MGSLSGVTDLAAAYEKASGHKVVVAARIGPALPKALDSNEPGDIIANFTQAFDGLIKQGKVVAGTRGRVRPRRRRRRRSGRARRSPTSARSTPTSRPC